MTSRKRHVGDTATTIKPKREDALELPPPYICALDPNSALLRRVFFLNEDRNKYISVALYPRQGYSVLVELGAVKSAPLRLSEHQFAKVTEHLPALIQTVCVDEYY
jgi:hypothetical protein